MEIKEQQVVTLTYELKLEGGQFIDEATEESPLAFIHGIGQMLPAFDAALKGKKAGDQFEFSVSSEEGYGEYDLEKIIDLERNIFADAPEDSLELGKTLPMQMGDPENPDMVQTAYGTILEVDEEKVKMDFNHPLAGKGLKFAVKILEVREAQPSELDHGHAHGAHGHQH